MYEFLFLDLDETILDFHKAERVAVTRAFSEAGITPTEELLSLSKQINIDYWKRLERGEVSREEVRIGRFRDTFQILGIDADPVQCSAAYEQYLATGHYFLPGAEEAVHRLAKKYRLFLASNGTSKVQAGRLASAKLVPYFEQIFVSEEIGANKPNREYFDRCFSQIADFDPRRALIVGDSLSSDILGGNNAGIATCWVNRAGAPRPENLRIDYEIPALSALEEMLDAL